MDSSTHRLIDIFTPSATAFQRLQDKNQKLRSKCFLPHHTIGRIVHASINLQFGLIEPSVISRSENKEMTPRSKKLWLRKDESPHEHQIRLVTCFTLFRIVYHPVISVLKVLNRNFMFMILTLGHIHIRLNSFCNHLSTVICTYFKAIVSKFREWYFVIANLHPNDPQVYNEKWMSLVYSSTYRNRAATPITSKSI